MGKFKTGTKQGVALTGRNRTGPPCSVGHPTAHAPAGSAALQTTDAREQSNTGRLGGPVININIGLTRNLHITTIYKN